MTNILIVTAATAYDNPSNGMTVILILHQALYLGDKVNNSLLCPNQPHNYGLEVDDAPIDLAPISKPSTHSIHCPDEDFRLYRDSYHVSIVEPLRKKRLNPINGSH